MLRSAVVLSSALAIVAMCGTAQGQELSFAKVAIENGDANGDWQIDVSDGISLFRHLFIGGPAPAPLGCPSDKRNGDVNGDSSLDLSDGVYILSFLFQGGSRPVDICGVFPGGGAAVQRSIEEFVDAQDSFCIASTADNGFCTGIGAIEQSDGCCLWVPPLANFFGWADLSAHFTSIDYAGIADNWIKAQPDGVSFGTTFDGAVTERALADGRAELTIRLHTKNALAWAFVNDPSLPGNPYFVTPLMFGFRAPELYADPSLEPALAESFLHAVIVMPEPGLPLPDLMAINMGAIPGAELRRLSFYARASGFLHDSPGSATGGPGRLECTQTGLIDVYSIANPNSRVALDAFPAERVNWWATGN